MQLNATVYWLSRIPNSQQRKRRTRNTKRTQNRGSRQGSRNVQGYDVFSHTALNPPMIWKGHEAKSMSSAPPTTITSTVVVSDYPGQVIQGTSCFSNRIGNMIEPIAFELQAVLAGGQTNTALDDPYNTVRISAVWAAPGSSFAAFSVSSILNERTFSGVQSVVFDKLYTLVSPGKDTTGYMPCYKRIKINARLDPRHRICYTGPGTNTESGTTLLILYVSDSTISPHPGLQQGTGMFEYVDL
jgi:hypothetical protein